MSNPDFNRLNRAYKKALAALLGERNPEGYWTGELSPSALATATAVSALALVQKHAGQAETYHQCITGGLAWLMNHQNPDGGWGDTVKSISNISTSMLCRAAFYLTESANQYRNCLQRAETYLREQFGKTTAELAEAVRARYGKDRTFAVPILTTCALARLVPWKEVPPLPFELACFPQSWFRLLRLPVVSYALPALIAIGQAVYHHRPPRNPITRVIRHWAIKKSLRVLEAIHPSSGGFLEATPLTSFVTLSLASIGLLEHPVTRKGVTFLVNSMRSDGSWPIDSNLATWLTTLTINALAAARELPQLDRLSQLRQWLLKQQFVKRHPYTGAEPGGWGWTDLPGSVPDADDTPGTLIALSHLDSEKNRRADNSDFPDMDQNAREPERAALHWLFDLQNRDGGWPTFCRGWGTLPFDRSGSDLTAHVLRALAACKRWLMGPQSKEKGEWTVDLSRPGKYPCVCFSQSFFDKKIDRGLSFLAKHQRPDGSWLPLWFGNQYAPNDENPTYGTARVLAAYRDLNMMNQECARRGMDWLLGAQNADGGWGGGLGVPSSIEETALAVEILLAAGPEAETAVNNGLAWLVRDVEAGGLHNPTPIGFYFAKLWYYEKLYPIIFTVAALGQALHKRI